MRLRKVERERANKEGYMPQSNERTAYLLGVMAFKNGKTKADIIEAFKGKTDSEIENAIEGWASQQEREEGR